MIEWHIGSSKKINTVSNSGRHRYKARDGDTLISLKEIRADIPGSHNSCLPQYLRCGEVAETLGVFHRNERYKWKGGVDVRNN